MTLADGIMASFRSDKSALRNRAFLGDEDAFQTDFLRTGIASLDYCLGGGFAYGRVVELFGNYSSGKTYVLYRALGACQRDGGTAVLFEAEGAYDAGFYQSVGGDPSTLILIPVATVEEVFTGIEKICKSVKGAGGRQHVCIGWDSIALTGTRHLQDAGMDKIDMTKALRMSQGTAYVTTEIKGTNICVIATNQVREKIGSMDSSTHTPGGKAWPFAASQRVELRFDGGSKSSLIHEVVNAGGKDADGQPIGRWVKFDVVKNKLGPPLMQGSLPFYNYAHYRHPVWGYETTVGVDLCEALFEFYLNGRFYLVDTLEKKDRVVESPSPGWYVLHRDIDTAQKKFRKADWPAMLAEFPILWNLLYHAKMPRCVDGA